MVDLINESKDISVVFFVRDNIPMVAERRKVVSKMCLFPWTEALPIFRFEDTTDVFQFEDGTVHESVFAAFRVVIYLLWVTDIYLSLCIHKYFRFHIFIAVSIS
jgi:hypothetical protein